MWNIIFTPCKPALVFLWIRIIRLFCHLGHSEMQHDCFKQIKIRITFFFFPLIKAVVLSRIPFFSHSMQSKVLDTHFVTNEAFLPILLFSPSIKQFISVAFWLAKWVILITSTCTQSVPLIFQFTLLSSWPPAASSLIRWCDFCSLGAGEEIGVAFSYLPRGTSTHKHQRTQGFCSKRLEKK